MYRPFQTVGVEGAGAGRVQKQTAAAHFSERNIQDMIITSELHEPYTKLTENVPL